MDIKTILLGFLLRRPMTGYELKKAFTLSFSFFSGLSYGSIYPALRKMEQDGWITMRIEVQDGAPNRKIYTITEAGREAFLESLRSPMEFEREKNSFAMRLFFFSNLIPEERLSIIETYYQSLLQMGSTLQEVRPQITPLADRYQMLCIEFGARYVEDLTRNVAKILQALKEESAEDAAEAMAIP